MVVNLFLTFALGPGSVAVGWRGGDSVSRGAGLVPSQDQDCPASSFPHTVRNIVRVPQSGSHSFAPHRETKCMCSDIPIKIS